MATARRAELAVAAVIAVCAAAALLLGGGWWALRAGGRTWLAAAVTSPPFIVCGLITLGCGAALVVLGGMLWWLGAPARSRRRRGESGNALIEFAMILPIALMLVLVMTQSSMLMGGNLCVHYAAYCAARSAIVQVPADAGLSEPPNVIPGVGSSGKQARIHAAAVWAVMPVSAGGEHIAGSDGTLAAGLGQFFASYGAETPGWIDGRLARKLAYARDHTAVELAPPARGDTYAEHEDLRVTVVHTFYLSVPYANWVFATLDGDDGVTLDTGEGDYGTIIRASCRLSNEGIQDFVDVEPFPMEQ